MTPDSRLRFLVQHAMRGLLDPSKAPERHFKKRPAAKERSNVRYISVAPPLPKSNGAQSCTYKHREHNNTKNTHTQHLHMNRACYGRRINQIGIELECLLLFLFVGKKCCCVRHDDACLSFAVSVLVRLFYFLVNTREK